MDWTDNYSRIQISELSENIILSLNEKLEKFYNENISTFKFNKKNIDIILRPSLNIAVTTFLERLLNVENELMKKKIYIFEDKLNNRFSNFKNLFNVISSYYNNRYLNYKLIKEIQICYTEHLNIKTFEKKKILLNHNKNTDYNFLKQNEYKYNLLLRIYNKIFKIFKIYKYYFNFNKTGIYYESCKWLDIIFDYKGMIPEHLGYKNVINRKLRNKLKQCISESFEEEIRKCNLFKIEIPFLKINFLFTKWIEKSIPLSLLEGLNEKIKFYEKFIYKHKPKYLHSAYGFYYNENFKIISLLAKKLNISVIGHDHGTNNFINNYPNNKSIPIFKKNTQGFNSLDYYIAWGKNKLCDVWDNVEIENNIYIINVGSVYLNNLKKKRIINFDKNKKIKLLFVASPSREFMASFNEISITQNIQHKKNVALFIKSILNKYPNCEITYKNFTGDYTRDIIVSELLDFFKKGLIKITSSEPIKLMLNHDIFLSDMVSTSFAEAINIGIPSLIYSNNFDYKISSAFGKKINDELLSNKILFYDLNNANICFENLLDNYFSYFKDNKNIFLEYNNSIANPINKSNFLYKLNKILNFN